MEHINQRDIIPTHKEGRRMQAAPRRNGLLMLLMALTSARVVFGIQFQSAGALGPAIMNDFGVAYTALGALVGAYSLLGIALALPVGWIIARFGTKRTILSGLTLMIAGSLLITLSPSFSLAVAGRLISGAGAVFLMVALPTVVLERFESSTLSVTMSVLISGFPVGIGLGFLLLPLFSWWRVAMAGTVVLAALSFCWLLSVLPQSDEIRNARQKRIVPRTPALFAALSAGAVWGLLNSGFSILLAFAPPFFAASGMSAHNVGVIVSLAAFASVPTSPAGAWLIDRLPSPLLVVAAGLILTSAILAALSQGAWPVGLLIAAGIVIGPIAGPIVALPGAVLSPAERPLGMAAFWLAFFVPMGLLPLLAGFVRDVTSDPAAALLVGALLTVFALLPLLAYANICKDLRLPSHQPASQN
jgi:predicted MFS family arabinose efflux permease